MREKFPQAGDTVQVRTFGSITVQDYQRGLPIAAESLVPLKETLTIDKAKYFAFDVDSLDVAQNDINAIDGYTRRAGVALTNAIDSYALRLSALRQFLQRRRHRCRADQYHGRHGNHGRLRAARRRRAHARQPIGSPAGPVGDRDPVLQVPVSQVGDLLHPRHRAGRRDRPDREPRAPWTRPERVLSARWRGSTSIARPTPSPTARIGPAPTARANPSATPLRSRPPLWKRCGWNPRSRPASVACSCMAGPVFTEDAKRLGVMYVDNS